MGCRYRMRLRPPRQLRPSRRRPQAPIRRRSRGRAATTPENERRREPGRDGAGSVKCFDPYASRSRAGDDRADHEQRPARQDTADAADRDQEPEPDRPGGPDSCGGSADSPATAIRDAAEERNPHGGSDVRRRDRVQSAPDGVSSRSIDDVQRRAACAERGPPGECPTHARPRERERRDPEARRIRGAESGKRLADAVPEKRWAEAEHGEKRERDTRHGEMLPCQMMANHDCTPSVGNPGCEP